jgi:RimJ/RimL family protein N-acetyltransferase
MAPWPPTVTLDGTYARLELSSQAHAADLAEASADGELHKLWYTTVPTADAVPAEIDRRLGLRETGSMLPFTVIDKTDSPTSGKAVGMTTFMNIDATNRRVEIGSTWYRKAVQRGPINTECKLMLLKHAFEDLDCIAVELRTHFLNHQSRSAIERLGARLDGVLRQHMVMANGTIRDTAVYSIPHYDWPSVKANLTFRLEQPRG